MKKKVFSMMTARAAMTLLALFCVLGGANAQKTLPYEYGFENLSLASEGWSRVDCDEQSNIVGSGALYGSFLFYFRPNNNHDQYLISPELDNSSAISVLFWYNSAQNDKSAIFEVGYSTTTNHVSAFTWDSPRTQESLVKHPYSNTYPAGTKYIAIKYCKSSDDYLHLDAFEFTKSAPVSLPYEYSVETYPEAEGWSRVDCLDPTDRWYLSTDAHTGKCSFRFYPSETDEPQYLISPQFSGNNEILMSFWYKGGSPFQVGYSTTTKDVSAFTWKQITPDNTYKQYEGSFSASVKYIAFKCVANYIETYLDDFSFEARSSYSMPTNLTMADLTSNSATITWTKPASGVTGYYYQYRKNGTSDWGTEISVSSPSASLSRLRVGTNYNFRVRACYGEGKYSNYATINFTTDCGAVSVPYTEGFEDGLGCWSYVGRNIGTNMVSGIPHDGKNAIIFYYYPTTQYLVSPEIDSSTDISLSFWYWKNYTDNDAIFQVGYSTTTSDANAFTWGKRVAAKWGWEQYEEDFPAGTKYVAIKYDSNVDDQLCFDDFSFVKLQGLWGTWLESCGDHLLNVIQTLNKNLGIGLTAAQNLANSAPCYVLEKVSEEEAQALADALTAYGATAYARNMKEPYSYATWLVSCGSDRVTIIRTLSEMLGLGLKEAKNLADAAPCIVLENVSKEKAQELADALIAKGATAYVEDLNVIFKALPYTYGFENYDLEGEGWSLVDCSGGTKINDSSHNGDYGFTFKYNSDPPQYLISPRFDGKNSIMVSFYCRNEMKDYFEAFHVGYSTTNKEPDAFTWGGVMYAFISDTWLQYNVYLPKGTKYVAIKYTSNDQWYLHFDDFSFEAVNCITLDATKDNSEIFDANKEQLIDVNFKNLTLKADQWNPICLPFDMTAAQIAASPLAGATIHEYIGTDPDGTNATIKLMGECTEIKAGYPYVVKFSGSNIENPTFGNVYFPEYLRVQSIGNNASFIYGTLAPVELEAGDNSKLYMKDEKLYRPESATTVNAFSFYFLLNHSYYDNVTTFYVDYGDRLLGDVNGDGVVDISDVVQLVNIILNDGNGGNQAADVNKDHNVDISDVVQLVNIILGN